MCTNPFCDHCVSRTDLPPGRYVCEYCGGTFVRSEVLTMVAVIDDSPPLSQEWIDDDQLGINP